MLKNKRDSNRRNNTTGNKSNNYDHIGVAKRLPYEGTLDEDDVVDGEHLAKILERKGREDGTNINYRQFAEDNSLDIYDEKSSKNHKVLNADLNDDNHKSKSNRASVFSRINERNKAFKNEIKNRRHDAEDKLQRFRLMLKEKKEKSDLQKASDTKKNSPWRF